MKRFLISISAFLFFVSTIFAQIPPGYYDNAQGLSQQALQQALHDIIDNHNVQSYSSIWTHVQSTDAKPNGKVWDMYSDVPGGTPAYEFTFISDQCGNYAQEGDCYNREHSWPKSWFNDQSPMNTDLHHIVPTDGYVNGRRSNYPFGEVSNATWTSTNGSQQGSNTFSGSTGICFEPIDEYKGDFARIYFYMATRYYNEDASWQSNDMVNGSQLKPWALQMLYNWHRMDTVSQKEIDRNNEIYNIQNNRNPFVDFPEWVDSIWQIGVNSKDIKFDSRIEIYPNPSNGEIIINLSNSNSENLNFAVYSIDGKLIKEFELENNSTKVIRGLTRGFYILKAYSENLNIDYNKKIIVYE
jgi:endonuclease I